MANSEKKKKEKEIVLKVEGIKLTILITLLVSMNSEGRDWQMG